jgi:hypothetical protein
MKTLLLSVLVALAPLSSPESAAPGPIQGRWLIEFDSSDGKAQLTMKRTGHGGDWTNSHSIALSEFRGLTRSSSATETPARFTLERDAGVISFDGNCDASGGSGRFRFAAAPGFVAAMSRDGVGDLSDEQVFSAAVMDVSRTFVAELKALGYDRLRFDSLIAMRIHGATPEYIRDLKALGYEGISTEQLVAMRIHGATAEFIRELNALGYERLSSDGLVAMRIHGATPEYIRELKSLGYQRISSDDLVSMRIHGVSPEFIRGLAEIGYRNVPVDELVAMRIHGVTVEFARKMQAVDPGVSPDELVNRKIHSRN